MEVNMVDDEVSCNGTCGNLVSMTKPGDKLELTPQAIKKSVARSLSYGIVYRSPFLTRKALKQKKKAGASSPQSSNGQTSQDYKIGDLVEILQEPEIRKTLDRNNKLKGLGFMPEMVKFCGKQFRILKKVSRIKVESTGELRIMKNPVFLLEGVYCDGEFHDRCERFCFMFWRPEWLKKV
jgi:hypothetical protein